MARFGQTPPYKEIEMKDKIIVDGIEYTLVRKTYDAFFDCHLYYVAERDEPFCDLNCNIEEVRQ